MKISMLFANGKDRYQTERSFSWRFFDVKSRGSKTGSIGNKKISAPAGWSDVAVKIAYERFFRPTENSVGEMVDRVVEVIRSEGVKKKYFTNKVSKDFSNELRFILLSQRAFFNSPVWFNCGVHENPQVSACFIQSVEDSIESIFSLAKTEALLFKYGSGSGSNFSKIRSRYESIGSEVSPGLIPFLEVLDKGAGSIKSGGTNRRAAKMVCLDIDHPEILQFIQWKAREEKKAKILIENGYDSGFEGEAYRTVSGQNSNNSVRVTDRFMRTLAKGENWKLRNRTNGKVVQEVPAEEIWQELSQAAYECADPGIQFHDTINRWHTCSASGEIRSSNPCSEYMFLDDSACNLASLNLLKFINDSGDFDLHSFLHTIHVMIIAQDILVEMAGYPTAEIRKNSIFYRPLGIGFCGLGAFLMRKGIAYDSDEGREWGSFVAAALGGQATLTSSQLARELGGFAAYSKNKRSVLQVLKKHHAAAKKISTNFISGTDKKMINSLWTQARRNASQSGLRNAQVTALAPTGTIGLVMDAETMGVEPEFSLIKEKKLSGGDRLITKSQSVRGALLKLKYSAKDIESLEEYLNQSGTLRGAPKLREEHLKIFDCAQEIHPMGQLLMLRALQPFISGAISKTVNLSADVTPSQIAEIYKMAYDFGLKSISIYRDTSKGDQPLRKAAIECFQC